MKRRAVSPNTEDSPFWKTNKRIKTAKTNWGGHICNSTSWCKHCEEDRCRRTCKSKESSFLRKIKNGQKVHKHLLPVMLYSNSGSWKSLMPLLPFINMQWFLGLFSAIAAFTCSISSNLRKLQLVFANSAPTSHTLLILVEAMKSTIF